MLLLRKDLEVQSAETPNGLPMVVTDPRTGEAFEFGNAEYFLILSLREPYDETALLKELNLRFGLARSLTDLRGFIEMLKQSGLLEDREISSDAEGAHGGARDTDRDRAVESRKLRDDEANDSLEPGSEYGRKPRHPGGLHLFRPEAVLDVLASIFSPIRHGVWLLPGLLVLAVTGLFVMVDEIGTITLSVRSEFSLLGRLLLAVVVVNLVSQIFRGIVVRHFRLPVPSFGIIFAFGLIPMFNLVFAPPKELGKRARLWIAATPILVRIGLLSLGILIFLMTRDSGTMLPPTAGMIAIIALISLLITANPLLNGDGYRLLCVYLDMPNLKERAKRALKGMYRAEPEAIRRHAKDRTALRIYAITSIIFVVLLVALVALVVASRLEARFHGAGVAVFLILALYLLWRYLRRSRATLDQQQTQAHGAKEAALGHPLHLQRDVPSGRSRIGGVGSDDEPSLTRNQKLFRYAFALLFLAVLFLPYQYETGGDAELFPIAERMIYAETNGIIERVFVAGGEWLDEGALIAQMANHREIRDLRSTELLLEAQRANIARLEGTPTSQELDLAEQQVETARITHEYRASSAARMKTLYESNTISFEEFSEALEAMEVAESRLLETRANLAALEVSVHPGEIDAALAEEARLDVEREFFSEQLRRTNLRMPIDARLVTMQLKDLENSFLEAGDLFALAQDLQTVRVLISVPEADLGSVRIGDRVRLKLWAYPEREFLGEVAVIYPTVSTLSDRRVAQVETVLENAEDLMSSGMTGYAKIEGEEMWVIEAYTRALVRFFVIEVWSWLP